MRAREVEASELAGAVQRFLRALVRRAGEGDSEAVEALNAVHQATGQALTDGVRAWRAFQPAHNAPAYSWTDVASLLGITRQAAQQRFGRE